MIKRRDFDERYTMAELRDRAPLVMPTTLAVNIATKLAEVQERITLEIIRIAGLERETKAETIEAARGHVVPRIEADGSVQRFWVEYDGERVTPVYESGFEIGEVGRAEFFFRPRKDP